MLSKLQAIEEKYIELESLLSDPSVISDVPLWRKYTQEHASLTALVTTIREYKKIVQGIEEAQEMLAEGIDDDEFRKMVETELSDLRVRREAIDEKLPILLLPKDPNDDKSVIVEIRGGAGGDEAALFSMELFRMYTRYAEAQGWKVEILSSSVTELGGMKEVAL